MEFISSSLSAKEANMTGSANTLSPVVASPASGPGALAGFEAKCSCGLVIRSSLRTLAEADAAEHLAYHARKGQ